MAKVTRPLFSMGASGTVGPNLTFRQGAKTPHVYMPPPRKTAARARVSEAQAKVRDTYRDALTEWQGMDEETRATWNALAALEPAQVSGWNLAMRDYWATHQNETLPDPWTYIPPPGDAAVFPGTVWTSTGAYTPPPGDAVIFPED